MWCLLAFIFSNLFSLLIAFQYGQLKGIENTRKWYEEQKRTASTKKWYEELEKKEEDKE